METNESIKPEENRNLAEGVQNSPGSTDKNNSLDYERYDKLAQKLKDMNYTEQQIMENLLRLNPELNDNKHIVSQIVSKYFPNKQKFIYESPSDLSIGENLSLTEETKSFIESVLRKQLDAFRNIIEEEREKSFTFGENLKSKILEYGPFLILIHFIFTISFLFNKGGFEAIIYIFHGPWVPSQFLLYSLLIFTLPLLILWVLFKDIFDDEDNIKNFKVMLYILIPMIIISLQVIATDRYKNQTIWYDLSSISDREYFRNKWHYIDVRDRNSFLKRGYNFIKNQNLDNDYDIEEFNNIVRAIIYTGNSFVLTEDFQDINKEIYIYGGILRYDEKPEEREQAVIKLEDILKKVRNDYREAENSLSNLKKCLEKRQELKDKRSIFTTSPEILCNIIKSRLMEREILILSVLEETCKTETDRNVRVSAIKALGEVGNNGSAVVLGNLLLKERDIYTMDIIQKSIKNIVSK